MLPEPGQPFSVSLSSRALFCLSCFCLPLVPSPFLFKRKQKRLCLWWWRPSCVHSPTETFAICWVVPNRRRGWLWNVEEERKSTYTWKVKTTFSVSVNTTSLLSAFLIRSKAAFQHNYMLEVPICCILSWNEASLHATVVVFDNPIHDIKVCIIQDIYWERGSILEPRAPRRPVACVLQGDMSDSEWAASLLGAARSPQTTPSTRKDKKLRVGWHCMYFNSSLVRPFLSSPIPILIGGSHGIGKAREPRLL